MNHQVGNINTCVFLGLGTNLGSKRENIELALENIEKQIGNIVSQSAFYSSEPLGFKSDNLFLNCAIEITTTLLPYQLLTKTQAIEKAMGRMNKTDSSGYSDRIMDIDILLYDSEIVNDVPKLIIPHPLIQERDFVLKPLVEIASDFIHPVLKKTIHQLLNEL